MYTHQAKRVLIRSKEEKKKGREGDTAGVGGEGQEMCRSKNEKEWMVTRMEMGEAGAWQARGGATRIGTGQGREGQGRGGGGEEGRHRGGQG